MVTVLENEEGYVKSYCEWNVLGENGQYEENGQYIYVNDLWIHPELREKKQSATNAEMIIKIGEEETSQQAIWIYWAKDKAKYRISNRFLKHSVIAHAKRVLEENKNVKEISTTSS